MSRHPRDAVILGYVRTPFGRYAGSLSAIRPDDLASHVIRAVLDRTDAGDAEIDEVVFGASNQAGEDNRNVGRMASLLAGLPETVPGVTVNRLCGSGLEAVNDAARRIRAGEADLVIAGGVESMSRAPLVTLKPSEAFPRGERVLADTTLGWRLVNPRMIDLGYHPISLGVTAGNASGINDGAAALLVAAREKAESLGLRALGRVVASASAGVHPDYMGLGPIPAVRRLVERTGITPAECDAIELNEAFAAQVIPCIRALGLPDDRTNPNGGAIAIGHPIAASGARLAGTLLRELE